MAKMNDTTLKAIVHAEKMAAMGDAYGTAQSDLASQRAEAMDYYLADMDRYMPTSEGRSKAISTDVADTVDGLMPDLLEIFMGSDEVVRFAPIGAEDEDAAQQETDYVNHCFFVENAGFTVLHSFIKDALIQKNGIVKFWWDEGDEERRETYQNLTDDAFAMLVADKNVELIEHTEIEGMDDYGQPAMLHDATVIMRQPYGRVQVMAVPPEEFLIARDAKSIADARYCGHVTQRTRSELIDEGYPRDVIEDLPAGEDVLNLEEEARSTVDDWPDKEDSYVNRAMQKVEVTEHFIRVDYDGDGVAELRKVTTAGTDSTILDNEPYDRMPFAGITPILMSHRFWGRAVADIVMEIQKINTALTRHLLDNIYYMNSQRLEVAEDFAGDNTIDDILTNRPGSPIRVRQPGGINPIATTPIAQHILPVLEHMDQQREVRTGVARFNSGQNSNALNPYNSTATGANLVATAGYKRIRLIARTFAETGVKDLFLGIHELILKHGTDARKVKLRNKWVTVDPRQWRTRKDMEVLVGLGTGSRDQIAMYLDRILERQIQGVQLQGGASGPIVTLDNIYHTLKKMVENAGFRDADPFFTEPDPNAAQQQQQQPDPKMMEVQGKLQLQAQKQQAELQMKQQENVADLQQKRQEATMDAQIEIFKAQLKAETDKIIAGVAAHTDAIIGEMRAKLEAQVAMAKADHEVRAGGKVG